MNAPNRFELYVLRDDEKLLEIQEDTKIPNAASFKIVKQDHTMANMIRAQLLKSNAVIFAGYKVPHPLEPHFILKVQTDGSITPQKALEDSCQTLIATIAELQGKFETEFSMKGMDQMFGASTATVNYGAYGSGAGDGLGWDSRGRGGGDYLDFGS
ncbi:RBP11-like subunits of RNA polymerase [Clavulina sp. PMI_390]|nr:RBP11-like subunits of RNA polymerase [Clavulina sp. PMI_390]